MLRRTASPGRRPCGTGGVSDLRPLPGKPDEEAERHRAHGTEALLCRSIGKSPSGDCGDRGRTAIPASRSGPAQRGSRLGCISGKADTGRKWSLSRRGGRLETACSSARRGRSIRHALFPHINRRRNRKPSKPTLPRAEEGTVLEMLKRGGPGYRAELPMGHPPGPVPPGGEDPEQGSWPRKLTEREWSLSARTEGADSGRYGGFGHGRQTGQFPLRSDQEPSRGNPCYRGCEKPAQGPGSSGEGFEAERMINGEQRE